MAGATDFLATVNSIIRTVIALACVGGLGWAGWWGYSTYTERQQAAERQRVELEAKTIELARQQVVLQQREAELAEKTKQLAQKDKQIEQLTADVKAKQEEIDRLAAALRLLKVDHRLAQITVLDQDVDPDGGEPYTVVEFREMNDDGEWIGQPRRFRLKGDTVYVDCWIVKFEDKYVEQADLLRSTSLCLFKSIYGDRDGPAGAFPLEEVGSRPAAYARGSKMTEFERKIWSDFWEIANDPERARQLGIRAAHGQANFTKVRKGKTYRLLLRASDGLTTLPAEDSPLPAGETG